MASARTKIRVLREDDTLVAEYLLGEGIHSVGRDPASAIYLDSEYISNDHARLYLSATGIEIEDLNSSTGTFLDGIKVRGKLGIKPGQRIKIGDLLVELTGESAGELVAGSTLGAGRYTLKQELGRGSMGTVWLAKDNELQEEVAIKLLAPELSGDAVTIANLKREVSKSRKLSHNNIIRIHDLSNLPGEVPFITLEYVRGSNMDAVRLYQPDELIHWDQLSSVVLQLCDALESAHQQKIVHRDLKPANIMVDEEYNVKLADFGIAATINEASARSSMAGLVSGTLHFMSPQQLRGDDPRASDDIYSLGATIYNLLTGHPPFKSGDIQSQILNQIPPSLIQVLEGTGRTGTVPDYVNALVNACLAKEPDDRPQSAKAIKDWITSEGADKESLPKKPTKTFIRKQRENRRSGKKTEEPSPVEEKEKPRRATFTGATSGKIAQLVKGCAAVIVLAVLGFIALIIFMHYEDESYSNLRATEPEAVALNHDGKVLALYDENTIRFYERQYSEHGEGSYLETIHLGRANGHHDSYGYYGDPHTFSLSPSGHNLLIEGRNYDYSHRESEHHEETEMTNLALYRTWFDKKGERKIKKWEWSEEKLVQRPNESSDLYLWLEEPPVPVESHEADQEIRPENHRLLLARCTSGNFLTFYSSNISDGANLMSLPVEKISNNRVLAMAATPFEWGDPDLHGPNWAFVFFDNQGKVNICTIESSYFEIKANPSDHSGYLKGNVRCVAQIDTGISPEGSIYLAAGAPPRAMEHSVQGDSRTFRVALASDDGRVKVWEITNPSEIKLAFDRTIGSYGEGSFNNMLNTIGFMDDGNLLLKSNRETRALNAITGEDIGYPRRSGDSYIGTIISGDGLDFVEVERGIRSIFGNSPHVLHFQINSSWEEPNEGHGEPQNTFFQLDLDANSPRYFGFQPEEGGSGVGEGWFTFHPLGEDAHHKPSNEEEGR